MHSTQEDAQSLFKLAQLWHFINSSYRRNHTSYSNKRVVNEILKDGFDMNYKVTIVPENKDDEIDLKDCTVLHIAYHHNDIDAFTILLEQGADFTIKNGNGETALHLMIKSFNRENNFLNLLLSAHVGSQNYVNPRNDYGISHLHGACIVNHVEAVELFLKNGASVDEAVSRDAPKFAGYTPLHFAVEFHSFRVAEILLNRGANVNARTVKERTPLDILIENKSNYHLPQAKKSGKQQLIKLLLENNGISAIGLSSLQIAFTLKDLTIAEQLISEGADVNYTVTTELESSYFLGSSVLYFAVLHSVEAVKMLAKRGVKLDIASDQELTPLDICINKYDLQDICNILSCAENLKEICLSDGETKLLNLIATMGDVNEFKLFLDNQMKDITVVVPSDSNLWPGYTILHLAVTFSKEFKYDRQERARENDKTILEECLDRGLSTNVRNVIGQTPIHLALSQGKKDVCRLLLEHINRNHQLKDVVDRNNLSYLHIACIINNKYLVEQLLSISDPNIVYKSELVSKWSVIRKGSTPLHIAADNRLPAIADILLKHGADLHAIDANGMAPIHLLEQYSFLFVFGTYAQQRIAYVLFDALLKNPKDQVIDGFGFSYLHVACLCGKAHVIEKLLDHGSDMNSVIQCDNRISNSALSEQFKDYSNKTPLQIAIESKNLNRDNVLHMLLCRDPSILTGGSSEFVKNIFSKIINDTCLARRFFYVLKEEIYVQKHIEEKLGLTKLHIACYMKDEVTVKSVLNTAVDVNVPVPAEFGIIAGCTPLHLLVTVNDSYLSSAEFTVKEIIKMLLDRGADVTINNTKKNTPIHVFYKHQHCFHDVNHCMDLLLNAHENFGVNPVNAQGVSHFHLACFSHNVEVVEKFLQHSSVEINQPVDYFAEHNAGCTPLHLALTREMEPDDDCPKLMQIVDLLLKHGANVAAKDVYGNTPLHKPAVLKSSEMKILEKLVSHGADIKSRNILGQSPIEVCPDEVNANPLYNLKIFEKYGYKINSWNYLTGEGYIAKVFSLSQKLSKCSVFEKFTRSSDVRIIDDTGRTAIHNAVATICKNQQLKVIENYIYAIDTFTKIGINIDHQDKLGRTALHYAVRMENVNGVIALLECGADVNTADNNGKSAFFYAVEFSKIQPAYFEGVNFMKILRLHIMKLQHFRMEISELNQNLVKEAQHFIDLSNNSLGSKDDDFKRYDNIVGNIDDFEIDDENDEEDEYIEDDNGGNENDEDGEHVEDDNGGHEDDQGDAYVEANNLNEGDENNGIGGHIDADFYEKDVDHLSDSFFKQIALTKTLHIGINSMTLFHFSSDTGAVNLYPLLLKSEQNIVDIFFKSIDFNKLKELAGIIKFQRKKMIMRLGMIDIALSSLRKLLGFSVPGLCEQISRFLANPDLENLIKVELSK